jgi:hypothetical protein
MFSKLGLSITAVLAISAAGGGARSNAGIPDSIDYANRVVSAHSATNDEINAAETGSPDSVDNNKDQRSRMTEDWRAAWQALESGQPDFG